MQEIDKGAFWSSNELQKSSTNSSLQQGSSSSEDTPPTVFDITHRHIQSPRFLESSNGSRPTDYLKQFTQKMQAEDDRKRELRQVMRNRTEMPKKVSGTPVETTPSHRHRLNNRLASPQITRTNTYAGRSDRKAARKPTDINMAANMAETKPIMPQQYRPSRPPSYNEACKRNELFKSAYSEMEMIQQTVNSARAKQLYQQSLQQYEQENLTSDNQYSINGERQPSPDVPSKHHHSEDTVPRVQDNNNTIGVVKTSNKDIIIKRAPSTAVTRLPNSSALSDSSSNMFYQPTSSSHSSKPSPTTLSSSSLASSFYRPTQPPPYKQATQHKTTQPDLIDTLGGESLV